MTIDKENIKKFIKIILLVLLIFITVFVIVSIFAIFMFNILYELIDKTFISGNVTDMKAIDLSMKTITSFATISSYTTIFNLIIIFAFVGSTYLTFKIFQNYGNLNKNQKGSSRFATLSEMNKQYRKVPEKAKRFEGSGGVPVGREKNQIFIDDSPVNNLIIGTTRSGKGETFVFSTIDIYSRAKTQASMVINDPKGELYPASKETLENLGYNVEVLNLMTPEQSMSYNLLQETADAFISGDYPLAEQNARSIGFMLYNDPHAKDPVWWKSSASLCTSLILGLCEQCKEEPEKITMYNVALMLSDLGSREVYNEEKGEKISALDDFFSRFPNNHPAKLQFSTVDFSTGQMRASILANTNSELDIFTVNGIAKLTSQTSFNTTKIGFKRWIRGKTIPNTRLSIFLPDGSKESIRTNSSGIFRVFFETSFAINDEIKIYTPDKKEMIIKVKKELEEGYYEIESNSKEIEIIELVQYEKPTALFMVTPDYDATFNIIVSIFLKQIYSSLSRIATNIKSGKCQREIIFLLDEFGNMPRIEDFTNIITVCLGRNMRFNLIVQSYSQLEDKYGEGWKTIDGNCGNTMYILTADESTAERISKKLDDKTITVKSRTGQPISLSKSRTESVDSQRLLTPSEVMALKEGEMLVIRVIKRQDKKRRRIRAYPLYLRDKTSLKYRFEYLYDYYDTDKNINDFDIPCQHTMLNLDEFKVNFDENNYYEKYIKQDTEINVESVQNPEEQQEKKPEKISRKNNETDNELANMKRNAQVRQQKEKMFNKKINENIITQDIIEENLLKNIISNESEREKHKEMGIIDFKDYLISVSDEVEGKYVDIFLTKINSAIKKEEKRGSE